ncbi:hypothetical protein [Haliscomenobacter sp.]|jgi:hypothetical protein|uniref:hypothetical protein n=1 Tax=Haliscomenobacter sp. TaxID=2717303 RepID=UPI00336525BE
MEHPFINNLDSLTPEQLGSKISELHKKLGIAYRTGNGYLCDQLRMAIESYTTKHQQKIAELNKPRDGDDDAFKSKIDIS